MEKSSENVQSICFNGTSMKSTKISTKKILVYDNFWAYSNLKCESRRTYKFKKFYK